MLPVLGAGELGQLGVLELLAELDLVRVLLAGSELALWCELAVVG